MQNKNIFKATDVFTPSKPARAAFVERDTVNDRLVDALSTPGKQLVVYGHSGSGKTTLLENKLHQLYANHITTRCMVGLTFEQIVLDAFDQLDSFYCTEVSDKASSKLSASLKAEYNSLKSEIGSELTRERDTKYQRILPPQLTPQALARFIGETECCWVIEDFHKVEQSEMKKLAQVMKVFMDMADSFNCLKIIAVGAVDTARQVVEYDPEMRNRVSEILVPLMTSDEIRLLLRRGESLLNISFTPKTKISIVKYSSGLASICHQLCLNICFAKNIVETQRGIKPLTISDRDLDDALALYLENTSDTLKAAFDRATRQHRERKYNNGYLILSALLVCGIVGATHAKLLSEIKKHHPDYPAGNLTSSLAKLRTEECGALVKFDSASGRYSFSDPISHAYVQAVLAKAEGRHDSPNWNNPTLDKTRADYYDKLLAIVMKHHVTD